MWKIQIPLPDDTHDDVIAAFCDLFKYPTEIYDPVTEQMIPNPLTQENFVQDQLAYYILEITMNHIVNQAKVAAYEQAKADAELRALDAIAWYDQYRIDHPEG